MAYFFSKVTISGVRGVVGESLFPHIVVKYVSAFGTLQVILILHKKSHLLRPFCESRKLTETFYSLHRKEKDLFSVVTAESQDHGSET